jgi:hypothetical protein
VPGTTVPRAEDLAVNTTESDSCLHGDSVVIRLKKIINTNKSNSIKLIDKTRSASEWERDINLNKMTKEGLIEKMVFKQSISDS